MKSYPFAIVFSLTAVVVGLVLQLSIGSISKSWFSFPYNVVGGAVFVFLTTAIYFLWRKTNFILRFASAPFAIVTVVTLGVLTIGLGSINVKPEELTGILGPYQDMVFWPCFLFDLNQSLVFYPQALYGLSA